MLLEIILKSFDNFSFTCRLHEILMRIPASLAKDARISGFVPLSNEGRVRLRSMIDVPEPIEHGC